MWLLHSVTYSLTHCAVTFVLIKILRKSTIVSSIHFSFNLLTLSPLTVSQLLKHSSEEKKGSDHEG